MNAFGYTSTSIVNTLLLCYLLAKGRPDYIPQECTIRQALTSCLEIRAVPRKVRYSIPGGISSGGGGGGGTIPRKFVVFSKCGGKVLNSYYGIRLSLTVDSP